MIEALGESYDVDVAVASVQRRVSVQSMPNSTQEVAVGPRSWFGYLSVPDPNDHDGFGTAVTRAFIEGEDVTLVLPDGRRGVIEIDDSLWFQGRGPWPEE